MEPLVLGAAVVIVICLKAWRAEHRATKTRNVAVVSSLAVISALIKKRNREARERRGRARSIC